MDIRLLISLIIIFISTLYLGELSAQGGNVQVTSSTGYSVDISLTPSAVIAPAPTCNWGYTYRVEMDYDISFSGSNIPPSGLWTLQGNLLCSSASPFFNLPNDGGTGSTNTANAWTTATDCATSTPYSLGCMDIDLRVYGQGIPDQTLRMATNLPVEFLSFQAEMMDEGGVHLKWSTASEENNKGFEVQRSLDGKDWVSIGFVEGAGNSAEQLDYEFRDYEVPADGRYYYRLKQVDWDGVHDFSSVTYVKGAAAEWTMEASPNPATDEVRLKYGGKKELDASALQLFDLNGKPLTDRVRISYVNGLFTIRLGGIPKGVYVLRLDGQSCRLMKH